MNRPHSVQDRWPHDEEAERFVVGACIIAPEVLLADAES